MADEEAKVEAKERLRAVLPHLKIAVNMAKLQLPGGTVGLGIIAKAPDGSGRVTATFEAEALLRDLETLIGDPVEDAVRARSKEPSDG